MGVNSRVHSAITEVVGQAGFWLAKSLGLRTKGCLVAGKRPEHKRNRATAICAYFCLKIADADTANAYRPDD
jgi:hypothetical protein